MTTRRRRHYQWRCALIRRRSIKKSLTNVPAIWLNVSIFCFVHIKFDDINLKKKKKKNERNVGRRKVFRKNNNKKNSGSSSAIIEATDTFEDNFVSQLCRKKGRIEKTITVYKKKKDFCFLYQNIVPFNSIQYKNIKDRRRGRGNDERTIEMTPQIWETLEKIVSNKRIKTTSGAMNDWIQTERRIGTNEIVMVTVCVRVCVWKL